MRRDPDYVLKILTDMAESEFNHLRVPLAVMDGPLYKGIESERGRKNQIEAEHIRWMLDDGLVAPLSSEWVRMTSKGMEFLESAETDGVLAEAKRIAVEAGGSVALELFRKIVVGLAKEKLQHHAGITL